MTRTLWIDADACPRPVKDVVFKVAIRLQLKVFLVANQQLYLPENPLIKCIKVSKDPDAADQYIVEHLSAGDIVITADIPLAAQVVAKGGFALDIRGELYTEENVGERLSMRDYLKSLRDSGVVVGGPDTFSEKDRVRFINSLNKLVNKK